MKTSKTRLAVAVLAAAGIYLGCATSVVAQNQSSDKPSNTGAKTGHKSMKAQKEASSDKTMESQANEAINIADDAEFFKKAYEGGLAEIALGRLAIEKASADKVKKYAQEMVDEHTTANQMIASMVSGKGANNMASDNATNNTNNNNTGNNNNNAPAGVGAGTGTVTGTGAGAAGTGAGGNTGTGSTDTSRIGSSAGSGNTNPSVPSTDSSNTSGAGSTSNTDLGTNAGSSNAGMGTDMGTGTGNMGTTGNWIAVSPEVKAKESYILSTELSAEHQALKAKLSKLSGAAFDKQYLKAMEKSHNKMWKMVYAKSKEAEGKDNASLTAAQAWAKQHVDVVRHHKEKAVKLMNSGSSVDNKN
ncbi:MAG: DUF4142 domain-containing protein [Bacteroidota bacterium]